MMLSYDEYINLRRSLKSIRDLERLSYPRGMLLSILQQKKVDYVKKSYGIFTSKIDELVGFWKSNKKFPHWLKLPPVLKVRLLLKGLGYSVKSINKTLRNPDEIEDERLRSVILRAIKLDYIYSPIAIKFQTSRGKLGEKIIETYLQNLDIKFKRENEIKKEFSKTPDFYFEEPVTIFGKKVRWIESKAMFGDLKIHQTYSKKQYFKYWELFGTGLIIYWMGCLRGLPADDGCRINSQLKEAILNLVVYFGGDEDFAENIGGVFVDVESDDVLKSAEKIVEAYANGFVVTSCNNNEIKQILKNMGIKIKNVQSEK